MVLYLMTLALNRCLTGLWMILFVLYLEVNEDFIIKMISWGSDQTYLFNQNDFRRHVFRKFFFSFWILVLLIDYCLLFSVLSRSWRFIPGFTSWICCWIWWR
jgi:hypothetical protein